MTAEEQRLQPNQRPSASAGMRMSSIKARLPASAPFLISAVLRILMFGDFSRITFGEHTDAISVGSCIPDGAEARLGMV